MGVLERCALSLGDAPWSRLAEGPVAGTASWNSGPPLDVQVRIRGAHSRRFPKKSLQLDFRGVRLPDEPPADHTVRRLHLNADYIDPTLMRSSLSYRLFAEMGVPSPRCRHVLLNVSGEARGIYIGLESVDRDFCRRRGWAPSPIFYAVNRNANFGLISPFTRELKQPLDVGYKAIGKADTAPLRRMLMDLNLASDAAFPNSVERWIDVDGYLAWLMVAVFVGNRDGFVHNYALVLNPESSQFRILPWDYDATWGINIHGRPARLDRVPLQGWNKLTHRLLAQRSYRNLYRRRFVEALNGPLSPDAVLPLIDKMSADLAPWIDKDRQLWGADGAFDTDVAVLASWAEKRRALLLSELGRL